jgi:hypothetical protein
MSMFEQKAEVTEIDLSYHNDDSCIVIPPEERPPKVDLPRGKDLDMKKGDS